MLRMDDSDDIRSCHSNISKFRIVWILRTWASWRTFIHFWGIEHLLERVLLLDIFASVMLCGSSVCRLVEASMTRVENLTVQCRIQRLDEIMVTAIPAAAFCYFSIVAWDNRMHEYSLLPTFCTTAGSESRHFLFAYTVASLGKVNIPCWSLKGGGEKAYFDGRRPLEAAAVAAGKLLCSSGPSHHLDYHYSTYCVL